MLFIRNRRYDTITPNGLPCHRETSIVLMSMLKVSWIKIEFIGIKSESILINLECKRWRSIIVPELEKSQLKQSLLIILPNQEFISAKCYNWTKFYKEITSDSFLTVRHKFVSQMPHCTPCNFLLSSSALQLTCNNLLRIFYKIY